MSNDDWYEYGIRHIETGDIHRQGMTWDEADTWLQTMPIAITPFYEVVRRPLGGWETVQSVEDWLTS